MSDLTGSSVLVLTLIAQVTLLLLNVLDCDNNRNLANLCCNVLSSSFDLRYPVTEFGQTVLPGHWWLVGLTVCVLCY